MCFYGDKGVLMLRFKGLLLFIFTTSLMAENNDGIAARFEKAKFEGVSFRAIGNEPGWTLEFLSDKEVLLITNLGQDKTLFTVEEHYEAKNSTEYKLRSKHNSLYVRIEKRLCFDTMVEGSYESTVYLNFDGHELRGCGKALY